MGEDLNLKEILASYTKHWKWFLLSSVVLVTASWFYLRYTTPQYMASAMVQILEENDDGLKLFQEMDIFSLGKNNILDEIEIIKSRSNLIDVVENLDLNFRIEEVGSLRSSEIYKNPPIQVNILVHDSISNKLEHGFYLTIVSKTSFDMSEEEDSVKKRFTFGEKVPSPIGEFLLTPNLDTVERYIGRRLKVTITPVDLVANYFRTAISIANLDEKSNIINISLKDAVPEKAIKIIDELVRIYNENSIKDKKAIADATSDFIDARIEAISSNLTSADASAEDLMTSRGITDIASEANINLNVGAANRQELANAQNQLNIASGMKDLVDQQSGFDELPANLGLSDPTIANTTAKYNELVQQRKRLLKSSNEKNPVVVNLDQQLSSLKKTMQSSLNSTVNNLGLTVNTISGQQAIINSRIYSAPKNERDLRDITRKQQTTEQLYLYLLQKREEAQIAVASTSPKCKVLNSAHKASRTPVSPKRRVTMMAALILGLLIPFSIIYINDLLDNKVHSMKSLESHVSAIPILGELPKLSKTQMKKIVMDDRSVLSEALRLLRTNLDYLIKTRKSDKSKGNVVFISSSVSGEGKTFVSSNLAMILASTGKKILLIGADIRNPKIYNFFTGQNIDKMNTSSGKKNLGLTEYLMDDQIEVSELINSMLVEKNTIDIIYSGRIPPNPAELLMGQKVKELFKKASNMYDYVIVDTAPLMVVTDTLLIAPYADHLIYVTRAGVTENKAVQYPIKLQEDGKIKGLSFVVNDVADSNLGYGGKYGYGYGRTIKKWWKIG